MGSLGGSSGGPVSGRGARRAPMAEINVTPLVDVMLVLLIIFMITAPLLLAGVPVDLPESSAGALDQDKKPVQLAIDQAGRVYAATNRGIEVFSPGGQHLGTIRVVWGEAQFALRKPANLAFAGPDKKTLYVFGAGGTAFRIQMLAQGFTGRAK